MSFRKTQTIKRTVPGSYVNGVYVEGTETTLTIQASVQPMSGNDLVAVPEGRRASDMVKLYTSTDLFSQGDAGSGQSPDRLTYRGKDYEIYTKEPNQMGVVSHYKYYAIKEPL
jgi:hypothetical protein